MASIAVKYEKSDTDVAQQGYKLRMTGHSAVGMSAAVFVMQAVPGTAGRAGDEFNRIASMHDMEELAEDAPNGAHPYYRVASIELYFMTPGEVDEVKANTNADVAALLDAINSAYAADLEEDITYGE